MNFLCYILYSSKTDRYYIGSTQDFEVRLQQHNAGRNLSTKAGVPWILVYSESFATYAEARQRELAIKKKKSRKYVEWLIKGN